MSEYSLTDLIKVEKKMYEEYLRMKSYLDEKCNRYRHEGNPSVKQEQFARSMLEKIKLIPVRNSMLTKWDCHCIIEVLYNESDDSNINEYFNALTMSYDDFYKQLKKVSSMLTIKITAYHSDGALSFLLKNHDEELKVLNMNTREFEDVEFEELDDVNRWFDTSFMSWSIDYIG